MKKWFFMTSLLLLPALVGCSSAQKTTDSSAASSTTSEVQELSATLILRVDGTEIANQEVTVPTGTSVLKALEGHFSVKAEDGFVTEIKGHAQEPDAGRYWMYQVNGEDAMVGARDYLLNAGDVVVFDLSKV